MYGTLFRMRAKPGQVTAARDLVAEWNRNFRPNNKGAVGAYLMSTEADPEALIGVAFFTDKECYLDNAKSPAQDAWFRMLRETLVSDPEWEDGEYIISSF